MSILRRRVCTDCSTRTARRNEPRRPFGDDVAYVGRVDVGGDVGEWRPSISRTEIARIHSHLIMRDYGIPLYRFTTLPELVGAYRDAIQGRSVQRLEYDMVP